MNTSDFNLQFRFPSLSTQSGGETSLYNDGGAFYRLVDYFKNLLHNSIKEEIEQIRRNFMANWDSSKVYNVHCTLANVKTP